MRLIILNIKNIKRRRRIRKICERFLIKIKKDIYYGELTKSQLYILKKKIKKQIDKKRDQVIINYIQRRSIRHQLILGIDLKDPYIIIR
ncbi:MAG: CRISPR-associated endonuclease Cas2 [Atribacterota bacterium]